MHKKLLLLEEQLKDNKKEQPIISKFMEDLTGPLTYGSGRDTFFEYITQTAAVATKASSACIYERVPVGLKLAAMKGFFPAQMPFQKQDSADSTFRIAMLSKVLNEKDMHSNENLIWQVSNTGQPIFFRKSDHYSTKHIEKDLNIDSMIIMPIQLKEKNLGVLAVCNPISNKTFTNEDYNKIKFIANQAAMSINYIDFIQLQIAKSKIDFDLSLAKNIQSFLLPKQFPVIKDLEISVHYAPAQKIGGDLYDVFELSSSKIGVIIADVSGKGVPASLLMAVCQTSLRQYAQSYDSPAQVLKKMNEDMLSKIWQDMFVTVVYAVIDLEAKTLTIARAGHEKPLLVDLKDPTGPCIHSLDSNGMAIGIVSPSIFNSTITEETFVFEKGKSLILYTDGLFDRVNTEGFSLSREGLIHTMAESLSASNQSVNRVIVSQLQSYIPIDHNLDDLTILVIQHH